MEILNQYNVKIEIDKNKVDCYVLDCYQVDMKGFPRNTMKTFLNKQDVLTMAGKLISAVDSTEYEVITILHNQQLDEMIKRLEGLKK